MKRILIVVFFLVITTISYSQKPCPGIPTVTYAGKTYNTVQIVKQCWLKENLDVGTMIQGRKEQTNNGVLEKYCYNNNPNNCATYGGLYQWTEAMKYVTTNKTQGICPSGWHIPTKAEFQTLATAVNNDGNALKQNDQGTGGGIGTNTSGFSALLAGESNFFGDFNSLGTAYFWSSTKSSSISGASGMNLYNNDNNIILKYYYLANYSLSVRCIKD